MLDKKYAEDIKKTPFCHLCAFILGNITGALILAAIYVIVMN